MPAAPGGNPLSTVIVTRQERRPPPEMPRGEILLESPPEIPETVSAGFQAILTYVPMLAGGGAMAFMVVAIHITGRTLAHLEAVKLFGTDIIFTDIHLA